MVKMSKRKAQSISYADAVADILDWVENPKGEEDFQLETNKIPDEIDSNERKEDIQPEPEEDTEEPHRQRHKMKLTKSKLVHNIHSAVDPSNYDKTSYLNKLVHLETFVDYFGPESNKVTEEIFWSSDTPPTVSPQRFYDVISEGSVTILLGNARNTEIIEDAFDFFLIKIYSLW